MKFLVVLLLCLLGLALINAQPTTSSSTSDTASSSSDTASSTSDTASSSSDTASSSSGSSSSDTASSSAGSSSSDTASSAVGSSSSDTASSAVGSSSSDTASSALLSSNTASSAAASPSTASSVSPPAPASSVVSPPAPASSVVSPPAPASSVVSPPAPASSVVSPPAPASSVVSPPAPASSAVSPPAPASSAASPPAPASSAASPPPPTGAPPSGANPPVPSGAIPPQQVTVITDAAQLSAVPPQQYADLIFPNGSHAYVQNNPGLFLDQAPVNDVETCGNGVVDADEECDTLNNDCCLPGCLEAKEENTPCNGERVGTGEHPLCVKYLCQSATCTRLVAKAPKLKTGTTGKITITGVKCSAVSKSLLGRNVVNPNFVNITKAVKKAADGNTAIGVRKIVFCNGAGVCNQNCRLSKPYPPTLGC